MTAGSPGPVDDSDDKGGLRAALGGLTTRGRSFLAAGVAAAVCAFVLGQGDLLRVGLLLAVLPLVCVTVLYRTRYRVVGSRRLSPSRVPAGAEARVHLRMDNVSRLHTGLLMLQTASRTSSAPGPGSSWTGWSRAACGRCPTGSAPTCADAIRWGPAAAAERSVRDVRADAFLQRLRHPRRRPAYRAASAAAAGRGGFGIRRRQAAVPGAGGRGRHHPARLPPRRRPATSALALHRAPRRADGASRGAAAAGGVHGAAGHPADRLPGRRAGFGLRVGGVRGGVRAGPHAGAGLRGPAAHGRGERRAGRGHRRLPGIGPRVRGVGWSDDGRPRGRRSFRRRRALPRARRAARRRRGAAGGVLR